MVQQNKSKYLAMKDLLLTKILNGDYPNQSFIPTERQLSETYQVSRITMRAALALMEKEGLITRVQGRGTRVTFKQGATQNNIDMVAIVSNAYGPFNGELMSGVNQLAEKSNSLVLFRERISDENIFSDNGTVHQLIKKNIKNIIVWTQRIPVPPKHLELVRGMGVNLVFFDTVQNSPFADDIALDNFSAVKTLINVLNQSNPTIINPNYAFFGCKNTTMSSSIEREQAFDQQKGGNKYLININKNYWQKEIHASLQIIQKNICHGIISANGYLAIEIKKQIIKNFPLLQALKVVTIDNEEPSFMDSQGIDRIEQPYFDFGKKSFELIKRQNELGPLWQPGKYLLQGKLVLSGKM